MDHEYKSFIATKPENEVKLYKAAEMLFQTKSVILHSSLPLVSDTSIKKMKVQFGKVENKITGVSIFI